MTNSRASIFTTHAFNLFDKDFENNTPPFKDHAQIPLLLDIFNRYEKHHVILTHNFSEKIYIPYLESIAHHLIQHARTARALTDCYFVFFDMLRLALDPVKNEHIKHDFQALLAELHSRNKTILFVIDQIELLFNDQAPAHFEYFNQVIKSVMQHPQFRILILSPQKSFLKMKEKHVLTERLFTHLALTEPSNTEITAILKNYQKTLESYHHITFSDDAFKNAFPLASHYLPGTFDLEKTLQLLDTAAAHACTQNLPETEDQNTMVTSHTLTQTIASITRIPINHLLQNRFQATKIIEGLRNYVFGQDAAIHQLANILENAAVTFHEKSGPLCTLLFCGPTNVGKTEMVYVLSEYLFGSKNTVLKILPSIAHARIEEIRVCTPENSSQSLLKAIQQTPYSILLIENVEHFSSPVLELLNSIFTNGHAIDSEENFYDFSHAIVILTSQLGADKICQLTQKRKSSENTDTIDLMRLVLNEHTNESVTDTHYPASTDELCEILLTEIQPHISVISNRHIHIVPFMPLDNIALEKILRSKMKTLAKQLELHFNIELNYAPEVIQFLLQKILVQNQKTHSLDKLLEQHLHACIKQAILSHAHNKQRSKRLLLQLNDSGELLRCEFITANEASLYSL